MVVKRERRRSSVGADSRGKSLEEHQWRRQTAGKSCLW